jgi:hypothetical protein
MGQLAAASEQELDRIRAFVETVEGFNSCCGQTAAGETVETHFVKVTSIEKTDGRCPGVRCDVTADGFTDAETCWISTPNNEALVEGRIYPSRLTDDVANVVVYHVTARRCCVDPDSDCENCRLPEAFCVKVADDLGPTETVPVYLFAENLAATPGQIIRTWSHGFSPILAAKFGGQGSIVIYERKVLGLDYGCDFSFEIDATGIVAMTVIDDANGRRFEGYSALYDATIIIQCLTLLDCDPPAILVDGVTVVQNSSGAGVYYTDNSGTLQQASGVEVSGSGNLILDNPGEPADADLSNNQGILYFA